MAVRGTDPVYDYYTDEELANYRGSDTESYTLRLWNPNSTDPVAHWASIVDALNAAGIEFEDA